MIRRAKEAGDVEAQNEAWLALVRRYERPIALGLRRRLPAHLAEDGVPSFFSYLYEKRLLDRADPDRGRFRCYVQGIMRRWAHHFRRAESAGVGRPLDDLPLSAEEAPARLEAEEEADWAAHVLQRALEALRHSRPEDVELLARAYGLSRDGAWSRSRLAEDAGVTVNALNVRVHHARRRLREAIDDELRHICATTRAWREERRCLLVRLRQAHPTLALDTSEPS